jgi:putative NADPH-quinone reductase
VTPPAKQQSSPGIVILQGHPDPGGATLCHALADAYATAAQSTGIPVRRIEVAKLEFPLLRTKAEFDAGREGTPEALRNAQADIVQCKHLAIFYPLWHGTMPALLKGFLEQVFRPDVSLSYGEGGLPKQLMKGKSARVVVTMGMPAWAYRWYFGAHSLKSLERNILKFCGFSPVRDTLFGGVDEASDKVKNAWFAKIERQAKSDAQAIARPSTA